MTIALCLSGHLRSYINTDSVKHKIIQKFNVSNFAIKKIHVGQGENTDAI